MAGGPAKPTSREQQLAAENEQLAAALGEALMDLRLWRIGWALYPASTTSTPPASRPARAWWRSAPSSASVARPGPVEAGRSGVKGPWPAPGAGRSGGRRQEAGGLL